MPVLAPMPSPRVSTALTANAGARRIARRGGDGPGAADAAGRRTDPPVAAVGLSCRRRADWLEATGCLTSRYRRRFRTLRDGKQSCQPTPTAAIPTPTKIAAGLRPQ